MKNLKKSIGVYLILFLLVIPLTYAQTIVEVPREEEKTSFWGSPLAILKSPVIWGAIIIFIIILVIFIALFFFIRWLIKFWKERSDAFFRVKKERLKLAKAQRRYNSTHWFKVQKNTPIRIVKIQNGKPYISKAIAYHKGDYTTHEGNIVISMNMVGMKHWFFFPKTDLLVIPTKDSINLAQRTKGKKEIIKIENLPKPSDIIQFNENEILLYIESLSNIGMFYIPVVKSKDGKVLDLSMPVYQSLKNVVMGDYLFEQTDEFVKVAKKSIDMSPQLRYDMKTKDTSQNVEVPSGAGVQ